MNPVAILFPGQGSQYVGMGKRLYTEFSVAKKVFEEANDILKYDISKLCFEGDLKSLTRTDNTQPAIFTVSVAAYKAYMEEVGIQPYCSAGHSLGEFSALCCSGAIDFSDTLKMVKRRGELMHHTSEEGHGAMAAIGGIENQFIEDICVQASSNNSIVEIACYNSPDQIVISGHTEAVHKAGEMLKSIGGQVNYLKVGAAFHSSLMSGVAKALNMELQKYQYKMPKWQVVSNFNGLVYTNTLDIIENLTLQLHKPVQWQASMRQLYNKGIRTFIEVGPNTVLKNLSRKNIIHASSFSYDREEDISALIKLANTKDRTLKTTFIDCCLAAAVSTKNYNDNMQEYKVGVIEPYKRLVKMQQELGGEAFVTKEQQLQAIENLTIIFKTKLIPIEERDERIAEILSREF